MPNAPETSRVKRDLHTLNSSLVRLDGDTGALLGRWRLHDPRLRLRHLAGHPGRKVLGIALQAEHHDTSASTPNAGETGIRGYGGSIAATPDGRAVSRP